MSSKDTEFYNTQEAPATRQASPPRSASLSSRHPKDQRPRARLATLDELRATVLSAYLQPVPSDKTLRAWFKEAGIPRLKSNPTAKHGGGIVWWHVAAVEKLLRQKAGLIGYGNVEVAP